MQDTAMQERCSPDFASGRIRVTNDAAMLKTCLENAMRVSSLAIATAVVVAGSAAALAEDWPARPVTLVVPFTSGTTSDVVARAFVDHVAKAIGATIVIDNRGGAGGNI